MDIKKLEYLLYNYSNMDVDIADMENKIEQLTTSKNDIYETVLKAQKIKDMPHAPEGTISDPVYEINIELGKINSQILDIIKIKTATIIENTTVFIAYHRLADERHKEVIKHRYFNRCSWKYISKMMNYSIIRCKEIRVEALDILSKRIE